MNMSRDDIARSLNLPVECIKCSKCMSYDDTSSTGSYCNFWKMITEPDDYCTCIFTEIDGMKHELKILPEYFKPVKDGIKNFEIRKNDRNFQVGDTLILKEWDVDGYT